MQVAAPEKVEAGEHDVPLKLDLGTASTPAVPASK